MAQRHADASQQLPRTERLGQVVVGTLLEGSDLVTFAAARGEHHDGSAGVAADRADDLQAIKVRQAKVEQHQVRPVARIGLERFLPGRGPLHPKVVLAQVGLHGANERRLVVHHQNPRAAALAHVTGLSTASPSGKEKVKRAPPPGRFSTQIRPPCASTRPLATASPRPRPAGRGVPSATR